MPSRIVVVSTAYNTIPWIRKNILSVDEQKGFANKLRHYYITDHSDTRTAGVNICRNLEFTSIVSGTQNCAIGNIYDLVHSECKPDDIIVFLDGDDWFWRDDALAIVAKEYERTETWMTWGQFVVWPTCQMGWARRYLPDELSHPRRVWCTTHLKTCKAGLFMEIPKSAILRNGKWPTVAADLAFMWPMVEMCANMHYIRTRFISDVLYVYNVSTLGIRSGAEQSLIDEVTGYYASLPSFPALTKAPWL